MSPLRCESSEVRWESLPPELLSREGSSDRVASESEVICVGKKGKRYSPGFLFQVVLEVLKGDRDAVEIARAYDPAPYDGSTLET